MMVLPPFLMCQSEKTRVSPSGASHCGRKCENCVRPLSVGSCVCTIFVSLCLLLVLVFSVFQINYSNQTNITRDFLFFAHTTCCLLSYSYFLSFFTRQVVYRRLRAGMSPLSFWMKMDRRERGFEPIPPRCPFDEECGQEESSSHCNKDPSSLLHRSLHKSLPPTKELESASPNKSDTTTMPPSKTEDVELLVVPLRGSPQKDKFDVERGEDSPSKTNFLTNGASLKAIWSCLLYSFCSVSMILTNKSLASRYV